MWSCVHFKPASTIDFVLPSCQFGGFMVSISHIGKVGSNIAIAISGNKIAPEKEK